MTALVKAAAADPVHTLIVAVAVLTAVAAQLAAFPVAVHVIAGVVGVLTSVLAVLKGVSVALAASPPK